MFSAIRRTLPLVLLSFISCVAAVGPSIEAPRLPEPKETNDILPVLVNVASFQDVRLLDDNSKAVSPEGDVSQIVREAFSDHLSKRGGTNEPTSSIKVSGELRNWSAEVKGTSTGSLNSMASLYLEVKDKSGNKIYSGVFQGTRSSQFPLITKADIQDSLAFALVQAIEQAFNDASFRKALSSK